MRKVKYVTRTISNLKAVCVTFLVSDNKVEEVTYDVQSGITEDKALDWLRANVESKDRKIVMVKEYRKEEKCYALSEVEFMKYAHEVDAKTRKAIESESEDENETESKDETEAENTDEKAQ